MHLKEALIRKTAETPRTTAAEDARDYQDFSTTAPYKKIWERNKAVFRNPQAVAIQEYHRKGSPVKDIPDDRFPMRSYQRTALINTVAGEHSSLDPGELERGDAYIKQVLTQPTRAKAYEAAKGFQGPGLARTAPDQEDAKRVEKVKIYDRLRERLKPSSALKALNPEDRKMIEKEISKGTIFAGTPQGQGHLKTALLRKTATTRKQAVRNALHKQAGPYEPMGAAAAPKPSVVGIAPSAAKAKAEATAAAAASKPTKRGHLTMGSPTFRSMQPEMLKRIQDALGKPGLADAAPQLGLAEAAPQLGGPAAGAAQGGIHEPAKLPPPSAAQAAPKTPREISRGGIHERPSTPLTGTTQRPAAPAAPAPTAALGKSVNKVIQNPAKAMERGISSFSNFLSGKRK